MCDLDLKNKIRKQDLELDSHEGYAAVSFLGLPQLHVKENVCVNHICTTHPH